MRQPEVSSAPSRVPRQCAVFQKLFHDFRRNHRHGIVTALLRVYKTKRLV
jgi:hypothetical protein